MSSENVQAWYAVHTRSHFERLVAEELAAKGFEHYCPVYREVHQWADRKKLIERPVFPGYVFVRCSLTAQVRVDLLRTHGVVRILGSNAIPEPIPEAELQPIRMMLGSASAIGWHPFLQTGESVRIRRGPLKGLEGVLVRIKNSARLVFSITLLSQSISTEIDIRDVEAVGNQKRGKTRSAAAA